MPYSEPVAARVRAALADLPGITERKMFGGIAFMFQGNMVCGVLEDRLVLRLGDEGAKEALSEPHTRPMDFTGRPMRSMVYVDPPGFATDAGLRAWLARAIDLVRTLPPK